MDKVKRFRELIIALKKRGLIINKSDLAEKLGTYNHVVGSIEKGKRQLTVGQLELLYKLFNVSTNWLLYGVGQMFMVVVEIKKQTQVITL